MHLLGQVGCCGRNFFTKHHNTRPTPHNAFIIRNYSSEFVKNPHTQEQVDGLIYIPNYLSEEQANKLLAHVDSRPWFDSLISRRIQCYGIHYYYTKLFHAGLQPMRRSLLPLHELEFVTTRIEQDFSGIGIKFMKDEEIVGLPDYYELSSDSDSSTLASPSIGYETIEDDRINQCLVQEYYHHTIAKHVDNTNVFGKEIVGLSLVNSCEMDFENVENPEMNFKVLIEPNSLLIMTKDARFKWKHGIKRRKNYPRRISLTFRHLLYSPETTRFENNIFEATTSSSPPTTTTNSTLLSQLHYLNQHQQQQPLNSSHNQHLSLLGHETSQTLLLDNAGMLTSSATTMSQPSQQSSYVMSMLSGSVNHHNHTTTLTPAVQQQISNNNDNNTLLSQQQQPLTDELVFYKEIDQALSDYDSSLGLKVIHDATSQQQQQQYGLPQDLILSNMMMMNSGLVNHSSTCHAGSGTTATTATTTTTTPTLSVGPLGHQVIGGAAPAHNIQAFLQHQHQQQQQLSFQHQPQGNDHSQPNTITSLMMSMGGQNVVATGSPSSGMVFGQTPTNAPASNNSQHAFLIHQQGYSQQQPVLFHHQNNPSNLPVNSVSGTNNNGFMFQASQFQQQSFNTPFMINTSNNINNSNNNNHMMVSSPSSPLPTTVIANPFQQQSTSTMMMNNSFPIKSVENIKMESDRRKKRSNSTNSVMSIDSTSSSVNLQKHIHVRSHSNNTHQQHPNLSYAFHNSNNNINNNNMTPQSPLVLNTNHGNNRAIYSEPSSPVMMMGSSPIMINNNNNMMMTSSPTCSPTLSSSLPSTQSRRSRSGSMSSSGGGSTHKPSVPKRTSSLQFHTFFCDEEGNVKQQSSAAATNTTSSSPPTLNTTTTMNSSSNSTSTTTGASSSVVGNTSPMMASSPTIAKLNQIENRKKRSQSDGNLQMFEQKQSKKKSSGLNSPQTMFEQQQTELNTNSPGGSTQFTFVDNSSPNLSLQQQQALFSKKNYMPTYVLRHNIYDEFKFKSKNPNQKYYKFFANQ
ncbi:hypothetical protein C9374_007883 [Naegleria lovaniensis]|uniref:Alpha-ketoglutarate-dependent dioxygenase AlkB-like domain-containing protein n=1 Tax=Naegleria lovaniensis TaxID=51637 RepID=A0AA88GKE9_NAELO|nr:uncharacterized protein C9374_007883 [Naegleria lovaniensis]KAG2378735.1 hypothetical protein C9374_007883 [Naegleria lovaniensis]